MIYRTYSWIRGRGLNGGLLIHVMLANPAILGCTDPFYVERYGGTGDWFLFDSGSFRMHLQAAKAFDLLQRRIL